MVGFSLEASARELFVLEIPSSHTVDLYLNHLLDREVTSSYEFRLLSIDRGIPSLLGETSITIFVMVIPDNLDSGCPLVQNM